MRYLIFILPVFTLFFSTASSQDFQKAGESEVDMGRVQLAEKFAHSYLTNSKNGTWYQFTDEATEALKTAMTEEKQKATYSQLKNVFGDFESLEYAETWINPANPGIQVIRFRGLFTNNANKLGIMVVLNESDKIAGFFIKPWSENL